MTKLNSRKQWGKIVLAFFISFLLLNSINISVFAQGDFAYSHILDADNEYKIDITFNLKKLEPNRTLVANAQVTNNTNKEDTVLMIVALYDSNNRFANVSYISKSVKKGATESLSSGFMLPRNVDNYKVKAFVWDGKNIWTSNMRPLSNVTILE